MRQFRRVERIFGWLVVTAAFLLAASFGQSKLVHADQFDDQIQALQQQNGAAQTTVSALQEQAVSYQDAVGKLQAQIGQVEQRIHENQTAQSQLQQQIQGAEEQLATQRQLLGELIKSMYVDGEPSAIEVLASSRSMNAFVDRQTYRAAVQQKVQVLLQQVVQLRRDLTARKAEVDRLVSDEQRQQQQLAAEQQQQADLLAYNQSQQAAYTQQLAAGQSKIAELRAEQARLIQQNQIGGVRPGDPNHGGYPNIWNDVPKDSTLDSWGMFNRECVSYTAYRVHRDYLLGKTKRDMPYWGGVGDAKQWPDDARAAGIAVDNNPAPGSIAISTAGTWGHSMYVETVGTINGQAAVYVSQYNTDFTGHYSEGWRYTTGLVFIHF